MDHRRMKRLLAVVTTAAAGVVVASAAEFALAASASEETAEKVLRLPIRTDGPKSLDPIEGSTVYDNMACAQIYETLLVNKYADPMQYEPLLLAELPTSDDGGRTWRFRLREDIKFHDNPCFVETGGKGRTLVTDDVFYSLKRLADRAYKYENFWLVKDTIVGLDEVRDRFADADAFDYDAEVPGFRKISDFEFEIVLKQPVTRFLWILTMFQTSVVPREAVEYYGVDDFPFNPVGTGPFKLVSQDAWVPKKELTLVRNPNYREVLYPAREEWNREERRMRMHRPAGQRVPFVDRLEFTMYPEDQPMWLQFQAGNLGYIQVPDDYFDQAFDKQTGQLRREMRVQGIGGHRDRLLDFIFHGFNMEDELVGGYEPERKALRQAISLAVDLEEINQTFYSGLNVVYDGPIPPGLDGHPESGTAPKSYRGPNLELSRQKLAEAGYPNGDGLPKIRFFTNNSTLNQQLAELLQRQLARINVELEVQLVDFSTLIETVNKKNAPFFSFAWSSDYPDAENNLALFYSPNESPGSNHYNYKRPEYDAMYEQILTMVPSEERTEIYVRMRDMLLEDVPYIGSMCRTRHYLTAPWLENCRPTERFYSWYKYLDVDPEKQP